MVLVFAPGCIHSRSCCVRSPMSFYVGELLVAPKDSFVVLE